MENKLFTTFNTLEGEKIVSKSSIAIMEKINPTTYRITLKEKNPNGDNISFETNINYETVLLKFQDVD
jgi:hypothetical protein